VPRATTAGGSDDINVNAPSKLELFRKKFRVVFIPAV